MLKLRILTALILIPLVIAAIFFLPPFVFAGVATVIMAYAAWEWSLLMGLQKKLMRFSYVGLVLLVLLSIIFLAPFWNDVTLLFVALSALLWFLIFVAIAYYRTKATLPTISNNVVGIFGVVILVSFWEALLVLQSKPLVLLLLLVIVWGADTAAYFGGRALGKTSLAANISPNKTMEGAYTALAVILLLGVLAQGVLGGPTQPSFGWMIVTLSTFVAAVVGDLFESYLKRRVNLKDSGQLLPGHGGLLDRIDALLAASTVFACGVFALGLV